MNKITLIGLSAIIMAAPASGRDLSRYLPPKEFDHPYTGSFSVHRVPEKIVREKCSALISPISSVVWGCAYRYRANECSVYIVPDEILKKTDMLYDVVLRHETAHCNGWPKDHPR